MHQGPTRDTEASMFSFVVTMCAVRPTAPRLLLMACTDLIGPVAGPVLWSGNSHYYELVRTSATFSTAVRNAGTKLHSGLQGHLVTITSAEENSLVASLCTSPPCWIGGTDEAQDGTWRWAAGPEIGQTINPTFWASGEPNGGTGENYLCFSGAETSKWNDGSVQNMVYVVEYESCKCLLLCTIDPLSHFFSLFCRRESFYYKRSLLSTGSRSHATQRCLVDC